MPLRNRMAAVATLAFMPAVAMAQPAEPWDVSRLEAEIRQTLDQLWASETTFTVTETEGGYAVRFPSLVMIGPEVTAEFGEIILTLSPEDDDRVAFDVSAPSPTMAITEANGRAVVTGEFAELSVSGVWSTRFGELLSAAITADGLALSAPDDGTEMRIGTIRYRHDLFQPDGDRWDSEQVMEIGAIDVTNWGQHAVTIDGLSLRQWVRDYNVEAMAAFRERYGIGLAPFPMDPGLVADEAAIQRFLADGVAAATGVFEDAHLAVTLENLTGPPGDGDLRRIANLVVALGLDDFNSDSAAVSVDLRFSGLTVDDLPEPPPPPLEGYVPGEVRLAVAVEDLPVDSMLRTLESTLRGGPGDPWATGVVIGPQLIALLARQDVTLRLRDLTVEAAEGAIRGDAVTRFDPLSALGTTARAEFTLVGFDELVDRLEVMGAPREDIGALAILRTAGREGELENGRSVLYYTFEQTAAGDVRLNDMDLRPFLDFGAFE